LRTLSALAIGLLAVGVASSLAPGAHAATASPDLDEIERKIKRKEEERRARSKAERELKARAQAEEAGRGNDAPASPPSKAPAAVVSVPMPEAPPAAPASSNPVVAGEDGVLRQTAASLTWAQRDNGRDINWNDARSYCGNLATAGGGWRLPSAQEAERLFDIGAVTPCGVHKGANLNCRVSPLFSLTGPAIWSDTPDGPTHAYVVTLGSGTRQSYPSYFSGNGRALCVRSG
jgi:hypothetical protein